MPSPPGPENRRFTQAQDMSECGENGVVRLTARDEMLTLTRNGLYIDFGWLQSLGPSSGRVVLFFILLCGPRNKTYRTLFPVGIDILR
jgi:hypothetical protein